ncbi:carbon-nitrogen hydrolase family protein [Pyxidicoccus fallax]|uniref:Carbon-nitrogen hydrolase family protein n=1 Tax=Pyxidicoccus fallax TaxID=394095 RepID=A0A848LTI9_9BACT|nr:carbon-nitrogen hydrolase family protein [Pyxidicoccus fallax]NMO20922.1 carbon-nitrogen hydrolase family protein [Pyxidicoccus fallax]NPC86930.1 carbon-nitrogen hydrolase family protein [Pyxidicoccus fallax]
MHLIAAAQMVSTADKSHNLDVASRLVRRAAGLGARLVGLPENFSWMGPEPERTGAAEGLEGPTLSRMAELARELKVTLLAGSVLETGAPGGRLYNTSVLFGPGGERLGVYRKMHLFDVEVGDGATYQESAAVAPGTEVVAADTEVGRLGLSVCYDLRFPELYRRLSRDGATLLAVPAAFTLMTGKDHWEVLLRARAIENQAYVLAPAQGGRHSANRLTYGHAMVVDPWGLVTARASEGEGLALAPVDPELQARIRRNLPCLQHRRLD